MSINAQLMLAYKVESEVCKASLFEFMKSFWGVIINEEPVYNWHIKFLCDELQKVGELIINRQPKEYDVIINVPPGSTKTTIALIMFPAWLWARAPWVRIISNSYSGELAVEASSKSKDIIQSARYRLLFPDTVIRRDKSGKESYDTTKNGARYTTSTGGTITGRHAHVILNDDPQNTKQADSKPYRDQANAHTATLSTRKVDKKNTPMITIMQRLHTEDVTGYLLKRKGEKIKHICLPAELSDRVNPPELKDYYVDGLLDPIRIDRSVLEEAKLDLGSRGYAGQMSQSPTVDGGNVVRKDWFRYVSASDFGRMYEGAGRPPITFFGDTAYTEDAKNDPSGFIATCKIENNLYITHAHKVLKEFPDLIKFLPTYVQAHGYSNRSTIRIEPKANGKSVIQQLSKTTKLNVTETDSELIKDSKETRLTVGSPSIECGRVWLVADNWNEEFVEEICAFPKAAHDEYVDLISYAIDYYLLSEKKKIDTNRLEQLAY